MSLELALKAHLASKSQITAIVEQRIWWNAPDPQTAELPDITFELSTAHQPTHDGNGEDLQFSIVTFHARSLEPSPCITINDLVRRACRDLALGATVSTASGDVEIEQLCQLATDDDQANYKADGTERTVYRRSFVCRVGFRHSTEALT